MQDLLVCRVLTNGVGGVVAHVASLLYQLVGDYLFEGSRPRGIAFGRAHFVGGLLGIAESLVILLSCV